MSHSSKIPAPRAGVMAIDPYAPGKSSAEGASRIIKLSSNESPLGASPKAIAAFKAAAERLELYPDGGATVLRSAIASRYGLDAARIVCGAGSDELLSLLAQTYIGAGDEGLYSQYGFLMYKLAILGAGGTPVIAPETDRIANVDALLERVTSRTKIVFLANPNNPTGTYLPHREVKRLASSLPTDALLVLDAAYAEYVQRNDYSSGLELACEFDNVVMSRTFSKIHGLAGLRIGWLYGSPAVIDAVNRMRGPFNVGSPSIAAGAAAINDVEHVQKAIDHNEKWLAWLIAELTQIGLKTAPSVGNFVLIDFPSEKGRTAADADAFLTSRGLILRAVGAYGLPNSLRMTVGAEEANRAVVEALREFMNCPKNA